MNSPCARPSPRGGPWSVASPACRRDTLPLALVAADVMGRFFFGVSSRQGWDGQPGMGRLVRQRQRYSSTITVILIYLDGGEVLCAEYSALAMYCRETGRVEADVGWDGMGWMAVGNNGIVLFAMLDWTGQINSVGLMLLVWILQPFCPHTACATLCFCFVSDRLSVSRLVCFAVWFRGIETNRERERERSTEETPAAKSYRS